jgi:Protein of unknown function (DUF1592)/Protein of unknown function (DUF1588)/Protein of unknown function (DUF1595)/Protein of unknown function (DUF1587)
MKRFVNLATCVACALALQACVGKIDASSSGPSTGQSTGAGGTAVASGSGSGPGAGSSSGAGGSGTTTGTGATPGTTGSGGDTGTVAAPVGTPTIARLSEVQWANSVRDLLLLPDPGNLTLPTADAVVRLDNEADSLFVNQPLHDDLQAAAQRLAGQVAADTTAINRLLPANAPTDATGKATAFIQTFGRRAYRRPLTSSEVQAYLTLFNQGPSLTTGLSTFAAGVRVTVEAFLQSPNFLYRTGFGGTATQGKSRLTDYEIAANLAYALTNSTPDATLSAAADAGQLKTTDAIATHAKRLIATTAGKAAVDRFYFQFFGLGQYDTLEKDPSVAPKFTTAVGPMLDSETQQFLQYIFGQSGTLRDIFTSQVTFVNSTVASLYGLTGSYSATTWKQVSLDATRPGVLTRLGFLAYYGHDGTTQDSIHRGVYINRRLLCKDMSPPPGVVLPTIPPLTGTNQTNRQIVNGITGPGTCGASCHGVYINPAGFAFENFNGIGAYQATENGQTVDASGSYPFTDGTKTFTNQADFSKALAESQQLHACYATSWTADLYARIPRAGDLTAAAAAAQSSLKQNISSSDLVIALVTNDAFVTRVEGP